MCIFHTYKGYFWSFQKDWGVRAPNTSRVATPIDEAPKERV